VDASAERFLEGKEADTTGKLISEFLDVHVKALPEPWRTRKSKLLQ
jgi:hypothetical protein